MGARLLIFNLSGYVSYTLTGYVIHYYVLRRQLQPIFRSWPQDIRMNLLKLRVQSQSIHYSLTENNLTVHKILVIIHYIHFIKYFGKWSILGFALFLIIINNILTVLYKESPCLIILQTCKYCKLIISYWPTWECRTNSLTNNFYSFSFNKFL